MVHFVLNNARQKPFGADFYRFAVFIKRFNSKFFRPHNRSPGFFNRKTALLKRGFIQRNVFYFRIDKNVNFFLLLFFSYIYNKNSKRFTDLRRRQANAVGFFHSRNHVRNKPLDFRVFWIFYRLGFFSQHRVAFLYYF